MKKVANNGKRSFPTQRHTNCWIRVAIVNFSRSEAIVRSGTRQIVDALSFFPFGSLACDSEEPEAHSDSHVPWDFAAECSCTSATTCLPREQFLHCSVAPSS